MMAGSARPSGAVVARCLIRKPGRSWLVEAVTAWWFKQANAAQKRRKAKRPILQDFLCSIKPRLRNYRNRKRKLRARRFNEQALTLVLAELYLNDEYKLRSEAAALLSGAAVEDLPAAQVLLGEVDLEMGLADEAQAAFEHALALAQQSGLPEFEAGQSWDLARWRACAGMKARPKPTGKQRKTITQPWAWPRVRRKQPLC